MWLPDCRPVVFITKTKATRTSTLDKEGALLDAFDFRITA